MVSEQIEAGTEMNELLDTLLDQVDDAALAQKRRDPSIPEGTILAEVGDESSGITRFRKQSSMVSMNGKALPERFAVYDRGNRIHMVPTADMMRQLAKPNFRSISKGPWPDVPVPTPIDATCQFCNKRRVEAGNHEPKVFYDEGNVEAHMVAFHSNQWTALLRAQEQETRSEESRLNREMLDAMMELLKQGRTTDAREVMDNAGILVEEVKGLITCPDCGKVDLKGKQGLAMHKRRWCKG